MARTVYRIQLIDKLWCVRHDNSTLSSYDLKSNAVTKGRDVAKANAPSQLVVHREDGTFEYEHTYGDDPYPPPG